MKQYGTPIAVVLTIYSLCFVGAAFNHARDIYLGGLFPYHEAPLWLNRFWTSLTVIDPLVAILIIAGRVKPAILLAVAIMVADVAVNTHYAYHHRTSTYAGNIDLIAQTAFLVFLLVTAPPLWFALSKSRHSGVPYDSEA